MRSFTHWIGIGLLLMALPLFAEDPISLNTSNPYKLDEFRELFEGYDISSTHYDLREIDSVDPVDVVVHKARQMGEGVLVDDTSLEVEGEQIGVNVRWLQHMLSKCIGKRAVWRVLLAKQRDGIIYVYEGQVTGEIVNPRGEGGYAFDAYLLPDGRDKTLAEERPRDLSARARAVANYLNENPIDKRLVSEIENWDGAWQPHGSDDFLLSVAG